MKKRIDHTNVVRHAMLVGNYSYFTGSSRTLVRKIERLTICINKNVIVTVDNFRNACGPLFKSSPEGYIFMSN